MKLIQSLEHNNCVHEKRKLKIVKFATFKDHNNCVHEKLKPKIVKFAPIKSQILSANSLKLKNH
jgi:hypothetical protein